MKQTAVEWLEQRYKSNPLWQEFLSNEDFKQAKAMEREQIEEIHTDGVEQGYNMRYQQEKKTNHGKDV